MTFLPARPVGTGLLIPNDITDRPDPKLAELPAIPGEKQFRELAEGTLGEFDYRVMLTQFASAVQADALAPALMGAQFVLLEPIWDRSETRGNRRGLRIFAKLRV